MEQLEVFYEASFKVSRHSKATRMYYLERALEEVMRKFFDPLSIMAELNISQVEAELFQKTICLRNFPARRRIPLPQLQHREGHGAALGVRCAGKSTSKNELNLWLR